MTTNPRCSVSENWHRNVALKIGVGGAVDFTPARVGQTLHIPCSHGHTVDFRVNSRMPPEVVAKKMIQKGWTVGSKLTCPEHSRKPKKKAGKAACGTQAPPKASDKPAKVQKVPRGKGELQAAIRDALAVATEPMTSTELAAAVGTGADNMTVALVRAMRNNLVTRTDKRPFRYSLKKAEPMNTNVTPITQAPEEAPKVNASEAARTAKRATMEWLQECFDVDKGRYKEGISDATIAKETGLAETAVAALREEFFGPLKELAEIEFARSELNRLEQRITEFEQQAAAVVEEWRRDLSAHRNRLGNLVGKNNWNH